MEGYNDFFLQRSLISEYRRKRPLIDHQTELCPFCLEESATREEIYDTLWYEEQPLVRIVGNKYPIAGPHTSYYGYHDVIIDTLSHTEHPKDFSLVHWQLLLECMKKHFIRRMTDSRIHFIQLFKNYGKLAGASIAHSHWQMVALEEPPDTMRLQYQAYHRQRGCFLCESQPGGSGGYEVISGEYWTWLVPPEPIFAYEVWLVPKAHHSSFHQLASKELLELGQMMKQVLEVYDKLMPEGAFNICMMNGDLEEKWTYHFHVRLMMRIGHVAGFEIATGCFMNTTDPKTYHEMMKKYMKE